MADLRDAMRANIQQLDDHVEAMHDERDYLLGRIAELEGPALTDEQKFARTLLADRLKYAAIEFTKTDPGDIGRTLAAFLSTFAVQLAAGERFSPVLCRRADKLAAALLGEDTDRG